MFSFHYFEMLRKQSSQNLKTDQYIKNNDFACIVSCHKTVCPKSKLRVRLIDRPPVRLHSRVKEVACNMQPSVKEIQFRLLHRSAFATRGTKELENHRLLRV